MLAKEIEVEYIFGSVSNNYEISDNINEWLEENKEKEVVDIKFGYGQGDVNSYANALIIYKKEVSPYDRMSLHDIQKLLQKTNAE